MLNNKIIYKVKLFLPSKVKKDKPKLKTLKKINSEKKLPYIIMFPNNEYLLPLILTLSSLWMVIIALRGINA